MQTSVMESKEKNLSGPAEQKRKEPFAFVANLKEELKKISWTTKQELISCTKIVVWSTFVFGMSIYLIDLVIKNSLDFTNWILHFIFG
ncbi:MAG: preprotein translocase subunit SecE [Chlamydiae bacterium]|nr:preprotein translocase subunit SecE [Chlamydiota bacterium]